MVDILVTENIVGDAMNALQADFDVVFQPDLWQQPQRMRDLAAGARAIIVRNQTHMTSDLINVAPRLEIVARAGVGLDNVDVEAASAAGVVVTSTPQANAVSVAELTIGLMLALARKIPPADQDTRTGGWQRQRFTGIELMDKTLGIVGLGRIGALVAERARAFGMHIVAHDRFLDPDSPVARRLAAPLLDLDQLLARADVVTCHVPLGELTRGMFDYDCFCQMKRGASFVNTSRGEVVSEAGLLQALEEGRIGGAALDVRQQEPPASGPLDGLDNVILTPHIGAFTVEAQERVVEAVCRDVAAVLSGRPAVDFVNFASPQRRPPSP